MIAFLCRRLIYGVAVLWTVATLTFVLLHLTPGGPFDREQRLPPRILANIAAKYHLDESWPRQYWLYLRGLLQGDLGPSYKYIDRSVNEIVNDTLPVSISLGLLAFAFALLVALPTALIAAYFHNSWIDRVALSLATMGISLPHFILGALLLWVFAVELRWLQPGGWGTLDRMILPIATLGAAPAAYLSYLLRSSIIDTLRADFIRTARAKGLKESVVLGKHAILNSLNPVLSVMGPLLAALVTGSFVVEYVFAIPGMGRFFITAVTDRDYPTIMGITIVYTSFVVVANLMVDILYSAADPRVRTN